MWKSKGERRQTCRSATVIRSWESEDTGPGQLPLVWHREAHSYGTSLQNGHTGELDGSFCLQPCFVSGRGLLGWWFAISLCQHWGRYTDGLRLEACTWLWNAHGWNRVGLRSQELAPNSATPVANPPLFPWQAWQPECLSYYIAL